MTALAASVGVALDVGVGEPPARAHPVVGYGALIARIEQRIYADRRRNGVILLIAGSAVAGGVGVGMRRLIGPTAATVIATAVCAAGKMLDDEASAIAGLLCDGDLPGARLRLRSLVGRTTDDLDDAEISRAVIESVAENSVDAVTASLMWATLAGAPGVLVHRAINTLDAMVGHHTERYERFGWASARADDAANYVAARATAVAVALVTPTRIRAVRTVVRRDAPQHPSPNGGVVEAAYAAALGVRLGGVNRYHGTIEDRGQLGDGRPPNVHDIARAVALRRRSTLLLAGFGVGIETAARAVRVRHRALRLMTT